MAVEYYFQKHHTNQQSPWNEIKVSDKMFLELNVKPDKSKLHTTREGYHEDVERVGQDLKLDIYRVSQIFTLLKFIFNWIKIRGFLRKVETKHDNAT